MKIEKSRIDEQSMTIEVKVIDWYDYENDIPADFEHTFNAHYEVCHSCKGTGKTCAHLGYFTDEDINEDPDFFHDVIDGKYDKACPECEGQRLIAVVEEDGSEEYKRLQEAEAFLREINRPCPIQAAERAMGA